MIYTYPSYYDQFKCVADRCPDTCCGGWQIVIDEESLEKYGNYDGEYKDTLRKNIKWKSGVFRQSRCGRCAFLRDDMLCDMYIHMGEDSLCTTCREYPRHTEEFENVREISLSLSCPEVAKLLVGIEEKVTFNTKEDEEEEIFEDFDYFLFSELSEIRNEMMQVLQDRNKPIEERLEMVLKIGEAADYAYETGELSQWEKYVLHEEKVDVDMHETFSVLYELELLYPDWEPLLLESELLLFGDSKEGYESKKERFNRWLKKGSPIKIDILLEQIMVYFLTTYFLGAVYDERILGKVDACVLHVVEIYLLLLARWLRNNEKLTREDVVEIIYRYSREIEHSDDNLDLVEDIDWIGRENNAK